MAGQIEIRDAASADAAAACEVLRRSIVELCVLDHHDDPEILRQWLANKTPEIVASWIADTRSAMLLAVADDKVLAVGGIRDHGDITLLYVSPDSRFRGVSRALLTALEERAAERGNRRCTLVASITARHFYHRAGYAETGRPQGKFGTAGSYPMAKDLLAVTRVVEALPFGFALLQAEAGAEGHCFLDRLAKDWAAGAMRFEHPGECLLVAHAAGVPAALAGLTLDPVLPGVLRLRRFYVRPLFRRRGIARQLVGTLLQQAASTGRPVVLNAAPASVPFWETLGFVPEARDGHTHRLARRLG